MSLSEQDRETLADEILRRADPRRGIELPLLAEAVVSAVEAIVARHVAEALEEAADALPALTEGTDRHGTATWRPHDRDVYSLAIEEAQAAIRSRKP